MTRYTTDGRHGLRRHRSAIEAVGEWSRRRRTEPDDIDGAPPHLDQISARGVVRIWAPSERPRGIGPALREALNLVYRSPAAIVADRDEAYRDEMDGE